MRFFMIFLNLQKEFGFYFSSDNVSYPNGWIRYETVSIVPAMPIVDVTESCMGKVS